MEFVTWMNLFIFMSVTITVSDIDIYIALDASDRKDKIYFNKTKNFIRQLIKNIHYYQVSPNYEIIIFDTEVKRIVSIADFKRRDDEKLDKVLQDLEGFSYAAKGPKTGGTNIAKAYGAILDSINFEKARAPEAFNDVHHVIIMFTDGIFNMGGDPKPKVNEIKEAVYNGEEEKRDEYLDLYVFGVGDEVLKEDIDGWVTKRRDEKHFYSLGNIDNVQKTFDQIDLCLDESTSVSLCGLYRDYDDGTPSSMRRGYPWLIKIEVTHDDGTEATCLGSLVTPTFILTAAHCFRIDDMSENIKVKAPNAKEEELMNNDLVKANFMSAKKENGDVLPKKKVQIKQGHKSAACIEDAKKVLKLTNENATQIIIDNVLCTGGAEHNHTDDISCKGNSGGATFVEQKYRVIQVGIISWGLKDICTDVTQSVVTARDFHTNLFSPEVQAFLKQYLGDGRRGAPLTFLKM